MGGAVTERTTRLPYDHALYLINSVCENTDKIAATAHGQPRDLDGPTATALLVATANAAIASALLAVADALRNPPEQP
jgi:hypothetical protein